MTATCASIYINDVHLPVNHVKFPTLLRAMGSVVYLVLWQVSMSCQATSHFGCYTKMQQQCFAHFACEYVGLGGCVMQFQSNSASAAVGQQNADAQPMDGVRLALPMSYSLKELLQEGLISWQPRTACNALHGSVPHGMALVSAIRELAYRCKNGSQRSTHSTVGPFCDYTISVPSPCTHSTCCCVSGNMHGAACCMFCTDSPFFLVMFRLCPLRPRMDLKGSH
jgi:hypothetical protein